MNFTLEVKKLHPYAKIPVRAHETDAGLDFFCLEDVVIFPGEIVKINTGIAVSVICEDIIEDYEINWTTACLLQDKSGLGSKGLKVFGGVIDDQYTGEIIVILGNLNTNIYFSDLIEVLDDNINSKEPLNFDTLFGCLKNSRDKGSIRFKAGDKIAQLVMTTIELPMLEVLANDQDFTRINNVIRGVEGFGSTGA